MVGLAKVTVGGMDAGALSWNSTDRLANFEFFPSFTANGSDISPIKMPLSRSANRIYTFAETRDTFFRGLPGLLADSLPAGFARKMARQWLLVHGIVPEDQSPPDLLRIIGSAGPGALAYEPSGLISFPGRELLDVEKLRWVTEQIPEGNPSESPAFENQENLDLFAAVTINCGRSEAAAAISLDPDSGAIYSGHTVSSDNRSDWILMLDRENGQGKGLYGNEEKIPYANYLMALDCGIDAAECRLLEINGRLCVIYRRTDRIQEGESGHKPANRNLHTQSLSALAHIHPDDTEAGTYERAFQVMRLLKLPHRDAVQLYRRLIFHLLTGSAGDSPYTLRFHMDRDGRWRLAPAVLYEESGELNDNDQSMRNQHRPLAIRVARPLAMRVEGKRKNLSVRDLLSVAHSISLKNGEEILMDMLDTVSHWLLYAEEAGLPETAATGLDKFYAQNSQSLVPR